MDLYSSQLKFNPDCQRVKGLQQTVVEMMGNRTINKLLPALKAIFTLKATQNY